MKLCCKHRSMAQWSPAQAEIMWQRLVSMGREKIDQQRWCEAVGIYGSAFETAEILLMLGDDDRELELERYKRTALEFIYCLRNSHYQVDFEGLIAMIHEKLMHEDERQPFSKSLSSVVNPLADIACAPLSEVEEWMSLLSCLSEKNSAAIH